MWVLIVLALVRGELTQSVTRVGGDERAMVACMEGAKVLKEDLDPAKGELAVCVYQ
jgi:hypothetical protein